MRTLITLFIFTTFCHLCFTQSAFTTYIDDGSLMSQYVLDYPDLDASDIYHRSLEWIAYSYRNSDIVIQSDIEDKMIRMQGVSPSVFGPLMGFKFDLQYDIQLDIKDNKLRFTASNLFQLAQSYPYTATPLEVMYRDSGDLRRGRRYRKWSSQLDDAIDSLINSLDTYILQEDTVNDDW